MRVREGRPGRAAFAVTALYGLLLSIFLGAMAPAGLLPTGVLCAREGGAPAMPAAPAHRQDCCTLGCSAPASAPPDASVAAVPALRWTLVARRTGGPTPAPSRPTRHARLPRGPPAA